jgi:hypothetical protein
MEDRRMSDSDYRWRKHLGESPWRLDSSQVVRFTRCALCSGVLAAFTIFLCLPSMGIVAGAAGQRHAVERAMGLSMEHIEAATMTSLMMDQRSTIASVLGLDASPRGTAIASSAASPTRTSAQTAKQHAEADLQLLIATVAQITARGVRDGGIGGVWIAQARAALARAQTPAAYALLDKTLRAEMMQLTADASAQYPLLVSSLLVTFAARIEEMRANGGNAAAFSQELSADVRAARGAHTLVQDADLDALLTKQMAAMTLPLARAKAYADLNTLQRLVNEGQARTTLDPANHQRYPDAYEYASPYVGIGSARYQFVNALTLANYQAADSRIESLATNLQAMLDNLGDTTAHSRPHKTDRRLMNYYGFARQKVIVVSLREQTARLYDAGKLVYWTYVTTGALDTPSSPGLHEVMKKQMNIVFTSPDPPGSPLWYAPTPVRYGLLYANSGFYLHDAWWRSWFGPYSNLPHYDPAAFNGGSHGCANIPKQNMPWIFNWAALGVPVIVY